jgi:hypothetical protein
MTTMSFRDAMTTLSDVLYTRAMEDMSAKSTRTPSLARLHARAHLAFEVKLEQGGMAKVSVSKYCAGYALHCTARIESPVPGAVFAGFVRSSDGGSPRPSGAAPRSPCTCAPRRPCPPAQC